MIELNSVASEAGKLEGMSNAEKGAPDGWIGQAIEAIHWLALRHPYMVSDDVWARGLEHPGEARALGPCLKRAQGLGYIEPTKQSVLTSQVKRHRSLIRVWRSRLYGLDVEFGEGILYSRQAGFVPLVPRQSEEDQQPGDEGDVRRLMEEHVGQR